MGAGASADSVRHLAIQNLLNKPTDLSDITTFEEAKEELKSLRIKAKEFTYSVTSEEDVHSELKTEAELMQKKRFAVKDFKPKFKGGDDWIPVVHPKDDEIRKLLMSVISTNILFRSCTQDEHSAIVDAFESVVYAKDADVVKRGDLGDYFYVCDTGHLHVYTLRDGKMEKVLGYHIGHGQSFGELALMYNNPRAATVVAHSETKLWRIHRNVYKEITIHFKHLRSQNMIQLIKTVVLHEKKLGDVLRAEQLQQLAMSFDREVFADGETIIRQGAHGDHFYIIESGSVGVYKEDANGVDQKQGVVDAGKCFGELALLSQEVRAATCIAQGLTCCMSLGRDDFIALMGTVDDCMNTDHHGDGAVATAETKRSIIPDMKLADLKIMNILGMGAFGCVKLCFYPSNQTHYALKCQAKSMIVENELEDHVVNEMHIMTQINDPFVVKLYSALQDDRYLYFCMELLQGGELYAYMQSKGTLVERDCRFYAASVLLALNSMHEKKIAYRDLKPENLVFDERGYIKLVDLGLAKAITGGKTWTICGTPDYIAPEIILHEGHNQAVDCWAVGVLIYEMMTGTTPFADNDAMKVYQNILKHDIKIPNSFSRDVADIVKKLLHAQQSKRFGTLKGGLNAVMKHKWLTNQNFADLIAGKTKAPYVPKIASKEDVSNFGHFDDVPQPVRTACLRHYFLYSFCFSFPFHFSCLPNQPISPWTPTIELQ